MKIDGVSGGVSGIPTSFYEQLDDNIKDTILPKLPYSHDSVWILFKGKTIHLSFLSFETEKELFLHFIPLLAPRHFQIRL